MLHHIYANPAPTYRFLLPRNMSNPATGKLEMSASTERIFSQYKYGSKNVCTQNCSEDRHSTTGAPYSIGHLLDCISNHEIVFQAQQHPTQVEKSIVAK